MISFIMNLRGPVFRCLRSLSKPPSTAKVNGPCPEPCSLLPAGEGRKLGFSLRGGGGLCGGKSGSVVCVGSECGGGG